MEFAIHDGIRKAAFKGGKGTCPLCGSAMTAKCGPRVMHHWAHAGRRNCDPWWENETPWHREWKDRFPESWREVAHVAPDGEIHRADIKTDRGIVIEVQHSAMTDAERVSREAFYGNLVWIIDGLPFKENFDIFHALPDPESELGKDVAWFRARRHLAGTVGGMFYRLSENRGHYPALSKSNVSTEMVEVHSRRDIEQQIDECYRGHHQYDWLRPRQTWLESSCPVFIDFGTEFLVKLEIYDETGLPCVRYISKEAFVRNALNGSSAGEIGALPRMQGA